MSDTEKFNAIYDEFRDHMLNKEYYARRIKKSRQILRNIDIFLALFAGTSAVLGFSAWSYTFFGLPIGPVLLALLTGAALVVAISRPYLKLEDELERLSSVQGAYGAIGFIMEDLVTKVKISKTVDNTTETVYGVLRQVRSSLVAKEDAPGDRDLIDEMEKIVNQRYPADSFYYPPKS